MRTATIAIECALRASVLRLCPVSKSRTRAASSRGTITICDEGTGHVEAVTDTRVYVNSALP